MKNASIWTQPTWNVPDGGGGNPPAPAPSVTPPGGTPPAATPPVGTPPGTPPADGAPNPFPAVKPPAAPGTPPDPNAPPPAPEGPAYKDYVGPPEGGQYADITVPEGFTIDKGLLDKFTPIANKLGLSQKGAQELADFYSKEIVGPQSAAFVDQISTWFNETEADAEIGGAKFEASTQNATKALNVFGTPGLKQLMVQYGIGNHPEVVRFFARVGSAIVGEDNSGGGKGGNPADGKDFLTKMYGPPKGQ